MVRNAFVALLAALVAAAVVAVYLGDMRWKEETAAIRSELERARVAASEAKIMVSVAGEGLPGPVRRYLEAVLPKETPSVVGVTLRHTGEFNMSETGERWAPFTSDQTATMRRPGFDWDARIRMAPGVNVYVHDAYVAGKGMLHAAVLGLVTVADERDTPDIAQGELMRFLAEAAWYPTMLLPGQGVRWEAIDERSARVFLEDGNTSVSLVFFFNADGLIETFRADARTRGAGDVKTAAPWSGRFWNYERRNGILVPLDGEVSWLLPDGPKPYWRGHITDIRHEFAR